MDKMIKVKPLLQIGIIAEGPKEGHLNITGPLHDKRLCLNALGEAVKQVANHKQENERRIIKPRFHIPKIFGDNGEK